MDSFIILNHINEIIAHKNVTMIGDLNAPVQLPTPLNISLRYVFLASIDDQALKTMIYDDKLDMYFYIYNTRNTEVEERADELELTNNQNEKSENKNEMV